MTISNHILYPELNHRILRCRDALRNNHHCTTNINSLNKKYNSLLGKCEFVIEMQDYYYTDLFTKNTVSDLVEHCEKETAALTVIIKKLIRGS